MECKEVLVKLREKNGLSQQELADRVHVTRQAVSKWERGETLPSSDLLKALSNIFNVSINTLLGSPRQKICQSCGMPLEDDIMGHDADGSINEDFCKWCYDNGSYLQDCTVEDMINFCTDIMVKEQGADPEKVHAYLQDFLPKLNRWKKA